MKFRRSLCWIRRDIRIEDNAPLAAATQGSDQVAVVFVFDDNILRGIKDVRNRGVSFIYLSLIELDRNLRSHGSKLIVLRGDPTVEIPKLAHSLEVGAVFTGRDYDPYAVKRDAKAAAALNKEGCTFETVKDIVIFEPGELLSLAGQPFRVYTPYCRAWKAQFEPTRHAAQHRSDLKKLWNADGLPDSRIDGILDKLGFKPCDLWLEPGEKAAQKRLREFSPKMHAYAETRDVPIADGTSTLSVDFRFGTISIRAAVRETLAHKNEGADKWLAELIWREFYQDVLFHNPSVVEKPFQSKYEDLKYPGLQEHWLAWRDGKTGYPLVDAAMRCLNRTGYMHNRLRMIVASFLTKDLLVDYREGEAHFANELLDYELASNNGGWQWAASVGCDPQPYFRIFNPVTQSEKFDPNGEFIRKWVPELGELSSEAIHFPSEASEMELLAAGVELGKNYPRPIVDHKEQREKAIRLLEGLK